MIAALQILYEFFNYTDSLDRDVLITAFIFVFMEPTRQQQHLPPSSSLSLIEGHPGDRRMLVMGKVAAAAMAQKGGGVLDCAGVWMHQEVKVE